MEELNKEYSEDISDVKGGVCQQNFLNVIGDNYEEIRNRFLINCAKRKDKFNEDIFHDTIIKCSRLANHDMDLEEVCKYLYGAYRMNIYRDRLYARNAHIHETNGEIIFHVVDEALDTQSENSIDINILLDYLRTIYDECDVDLFRRSYFGWSINELEKETGRHLYKKFTEMRNKLKKHFV